MEKKPNIIVFMTDQQNAKTIDRDSPVKTPNMDRFLDRAIKFNETYCASPHCCPSRASFFSGLMPSEHGVWNNVEVPNALSRGLYDGIELFPEALSRNGYENVFAGKWHVSAYEGPLDRGFDEVLREYISNYGRMEPINEPRYDDWKTHYNNKETIDGFDEEKEFGKIIRPGYPHYRQFGVDENPFGDTDTVDLACERIINHNTEKPLFMYVGTTGPHDPYTPPQRFIDMYDIEDIELPPNYSDDMKDKPALYRRTKDQFSSLTEEEHIESMRRYYAFCSYEDYLFGKVLDAVEEKGIVEDTLIIYLTDHGDYLGAHGLWAKGLPCFKEAYNICGVIGGYNIEGNKEVDDLVSIVDFCPTILDIAGVEIPSNIKGKSLTDIIYTEKASNPRTEIYTQSNGNEIYGIQRAVWNRKWKYVLNTFDYDELYDLEKDPYEMENLWEVEGYDDVKKEMCRKLWEFARSNNDNCTCPYIMVSVAPYGPGITIL